MNPKEKAKQLLDKFEPYSFKGKIESLDLHPLNTKRCALICVEELSRELNEDISLNYRTGERIEYWQKVKEHLNAK